MSSSRVDIASESTLSGTDARTCLTRFSSRPSISDKPDTSHWWVALSAAMNPNAIRHVSPTGTDTGDCTVNPCLTISYAITRSSNADTIKIAPGTYAANVYVDKSVTLRGAGANSTIIDGMHVGTVLLISSPTSSLTVAISNLTVQHGRSALGGGISSIPAASNLTNQVTIRRSLITRNRATSAGGGIDSELGSTLTISDSTVSQNSVKRTSGSALGAAGGGISNGTGGTLTVIRSTVSGNAVAGSAMEPTPFGCFDTEFGGGIDDRGTAMTIIDSTIANNTATGGYGDPTCPKGGIGSGGGLDLQGSTAATISNTTVAGNVASGGSGSPPGTGAGVFLSPSHPR